MIPDPQAKPAFRAGNARRDITPSPGVSLAGYFHDRIGRYVRDPLFARALVIESAQNKIALISCDLISAADAVFDAAKERIAAETGIPPQRVLICATHTHTGPMIAPSSIGAVDREYVDALPGRIAAAAIEANAGLAPAWINCCRGEIDNLAFNRLTRMSDGSEIFGHQKSEARPLGPAGPIDSELLALAVFDEEKNLRAMAVNFALHADVIGGGAADFISADWPGAMASAVAGVYGPDVDCLLLPGAAGDINHRARAATFMPPGGPRKAEQIGRAIAGAAIYAVERSNPLAGSEVDGLLERIPVPYYTRSAALRAKVEAMRGREDLHEMDRYLIAKFDDWPHDGESRPIPVQVLRVGEAAFAAFPAEMFVELGLAVKRFSPAGATFVVELANARASTYIPTLDKAERGAYGTIPLLSRLLDSSAGPRLTDAAIAMIDRLWAG